MIIEKLAERRPRSDRLQRTQFARGFCTSAAKHGASIFKMMDVARRKRVDTLRGYVRRADSLKDHAGAGFL